MADARGAGGTAPQRRLIERARAVLPQDERILAAWLVGSFATGEADTYSDVDLHCSVTDESADWFREHWAELAGRIAGPLVLAQDIAGVIGGYSVTPAWLHLDLILHPLAELDPRTVRGLEPLFDRNGDLLPADPLPAIRGGEPFFPDRTVRQFLYFLGNLPVGFGRGEILLEHGGIFTWRELLVQVMLAENGVRNRGGQKRLNPLLTDGQRTFLDAIPAAGLDTDEIMTTLRFISVELVRRGKDLAGRTGAAWPRELEEAALANVRRHLGVDFLADGG